MYHGGKVLEINPTHPVIKNMKARHEADADDEELGTMAELLFETASIQTGFELSDSEKYAARVLDLLAKSVGAEAGRVEVDQQVGSATTSTPKEDKKEAEAAEASADEKQDSTSDEKDEL